MIRYDNIKQVLWSIFVGACVAFLSSIFQGIADFINAHGHELFNASVASAVYLAKNYRV